MMENLEQLMKLNFKNQPRKNFIVPWKIYAEIQPEKCLFLFTFRILIFFEFWFFSHQNVQIYFQLQHHHLIHNIKHQFQNPFQKNQRKKV